jgi:hypothetical protein
MTSEYSFAISPQVRASFYRNVPPREIRGRRECRAPNAPAASHAKVESIRVSHHGHTGSPGIPYAMVLTGSFVLSPVTGLVCHRRQQSRLRQLDTSVGASGPHDFAVRLKRRSSAAPSASTASRSASVTIASRPSWGTGRGRYIADLGQTRSEVFLALGLDRANQIEPAQQFALLAKNPWPGRAQRIQGCS